MDVSKYRKPDWEVDYRTDNELTIYSAKGLRAEALYAAKQQNAKLVAWRLGVHRDGVTIFAYVQKDRRCRAIERINIAI